MVGVVTNRLDDEEQNVLGEPGDGRESGTELGPTERRKILRQHRDLRRVLAVIVEATRDIERSDTKRSPLLVALGLRLQSMMERHAMFEEAALLAHYGGAERGRLDAVIGEHRRQRAELSLLTKLSFGNPRLRRIGLAFRWLARNILKGMDVEERELFGGKLARRRLGNGAARKRTTTGEYANGSVAAAGSPEDGDHAGNDDGDIGGDGRDDLEVESAADTALHASAPQTQRPSG